MLDTLVVEASLSEPPSEILYFRHFTGVAKVNLCFDVVVESSRDTRDAYYKYLKKHGAFDFICDFVSPEDNVDGIRVDVSHNYPRTIVTDRITFQNVSYLISSLKAIQSTEDI